jgi:hypothetical protein
MRIARALAGAACLATLLLLMSTDGVQSQEKKDSAKLKGQLPSGWTKLDLSATQKESIYKLNAEYKEKTDKLRAEIRALDAELAKKRADVLTAEQKKKLAELVGADPGDSKDKAKEKAKDKEKAKE